MLCRCDHLLFPVWISNVCVALNLNQTKAEALLAPRAVNKHKTLKDLLNSRSRVLWCDERLSLTFLIYSSCSLTHLPPPCFCVCVCIHVYMSLWGPTALMGTFLRLKILFQGQSYICSNKEHPQLFFVLLIEPDCVKVEDVLTYGCVLFTTLYSDVSKSKHRK